MACFLVPVTEAIVTTVITKVKKSKEVNPVSSASDSTSGNYALTTKIPFYRKLKWLNNMLWGGSALLAFEHVWHGEIVPWFPFLTAVGDAEEASIMLHEMATVGVSMAILITAVWGVMLLETKMAENKALRAQSAK